MTRARDMANLGSQAGSGLDASDITTGVSPVGVTGGSGLTALGTVTVGDLSNSAIVYPDGHIITHSAIVSAISASQIDTSSETFEALSGIECSLTPKLAGADSKILVIAMTGHLHTSDGGGGSMTIHAHVDSGASYTTGGDLRYVTTGTGPVVGSSDTGTTHSASTVIMPKTDHVADQIYHFRICIKRGGGSGTWRWCHTGSYYIFYAYEVKI